MTMDDYDVHDYVDDDCDDVDDGDDGDDVVVMMTYTITTTILTDELTRTLYYISESCDISNSESKLAYHV